MHTHIITTPTGIATQAAHTIDVMTLASAQALEGPDLAAPEDAAVANECAAATFAQRSSFC
jgi:hypothetical protein